MDHVQVMKSGAFFTIFGSKSSHLAEVLFPVVFVELQRLLLGWAINVWLVFDQLLDSKQDLLDSYVRLPVFLLVQNGQTNSARRVDIGMRYHWLEDTFWRSESKESYRTG